MSTLPRKKKPWQCAAELPWKKAPKDVPGKPEDREPKADGHRLRDGPKSGLA
jgi:hypothetical protein